VLQALPPTASSSSINSDRSYATRLLERSNFNVTVRHTFLDVEEGNECNPTKSLRPSRSCGDLPVLMLPTDKLDSVILALKDTTFSPSSTKSGTETPLSSKESTEWKEESEEGDDNSTASAVASCAQDTLPPGSSTNSQRSGSPGAKRTLPTPAARRRERRRRAATAAGTAAGQEILAADEMAPRSSPGSAPNKPGRWSVVADNRETENGECWHQSKCEEEGGEVWLQQLWDGACNAEQLLKATYSAIGQLSLGNIVDALHAMGKCIENDSVVLARDTRLLELVSRLQSRARGLNKPRLIARALWGLGKVGAQGKDISAILLQLAGTVSANSGLLGTCTSQELTNMLWGLARLGSADPGCRCHAERIVHRLIAESGTRLSSLTAQCLANSLWALGKLGMRGPGVSNFAGSCLQEMCGKRHLDSFSAQGIANSLWACARLQLQSEVVFNFCTAAAQEVNEERLGSFLPQELSMTIWALAKLTGRGGLRGGRGGASACASRPQRRPKIHPDIEAFVLAATVEAFRRLGDFSPQGLSNICWALATMELTRNERVRSFLIATASKAMHELPGFPPQAIANLCWAMCRLHDAPDDCTVNMFASAVAVQARHRMNEFEWQDLAGIISAMNRAELVHLEEVHRFSVQLVSHAANSDDPKIGNQALLNMALSAARLGVEPDFVRPLAEKIDSIFAEESCKENLNDIDRRQWSEVRTHCFMQDGWSGAASLVRGERYAKYGMASRNEYSFFCEYDAQAWGSGEAWATGSGEAGETGAGEAWAVYDSAEAWQTSWPSWNGTNHVWMAIQ